VAEPAGSSTRRLAHRALLRIEDGARANVVLPEVLDANPLSERDRAFVTELVYGTTRMRRACDFLVERFSLRPLDRPTRVALRLGAYQLEFLRTPAHAAVSATVEVAPRRARGLVNAILRRVAATPVVWPDDATRLSYPDWIVARVVADLGRLDGIAALEHMNVAPQTPPRHDGYAQGLASQWVVEAVGAQPGERVADVCAAPGGKATGLAASGATVVASDVDVARMSVVAGLARRLGATSVVPAVADGRAPPWRRGSFDRVLVDAPCTGLGVLHRRPDARWRRRPDDIARLASLQCQLLDAACRLLAPSGTLVYSVCTLTAEETTGIDDWLSSAHPELAALPPPGAPWRPHGRGALLLPQAADSDGMALLRLQARA
jgi:16S rRNA (cytosine967-C5)-methyltransferase